MKAIPAIAATARSGAGTRHTASASASGITRSRIIAGRGGTALASVLAVAAFAMLAGCPSANPVQTAVPPVSPQVEINGLMHCDYLNSVLSNCELDPGVTLDELANSFLQGESVTE